MRAAAALLFLAALPATAELRHESFRSEALGRDVSVSVQLPPSYAATGTRYPLVVALHGLFEGDGFWERRGLAAQLDQLWARKALPEFVLVAPDGGNSFFVNGPRGRFEDLVTRDLPAWAEGALRLRPGPGQRALLGVSMGGYAALRVAFARPEAFGRVATHSAMLLTQPPSRDQGAGRWHMAAFEAVFGSPIDAALWAANDPLALAERADVKNLPALRLDCGTEDRYGLAEGHRRLHELLERRRVPHAFELPPGDHGYDYVRGVLERSLAFLAMGWNTRP